MKQLVVLDYSNTTVHYYPVDNDVQVDEEYISRLGFHLSNCSWMVGKLETIKHKGILK